MYSTPRRGRGSPRGLKTIPEGPIVEFVALIEETPTESWQKRTTAFQTLVESIPHGTAYIEAGQQWFNTPTILRHLAFPISELLKDARSTVVKRVCESLLDLFNKCQVDARYLFKDLMISILAVHAQTVHVIRQYVQSMVMECIPEVPCKMVMPLWMERLKTDKSRTVREACALYLGRSLQCWTVEGYLTNEIWMQVGSTLLRSLRDPSPHVRSYAKSALEYIQRNQPQHWEAMTTDPSGPVAKDPKLQKWLKSLEQNALAGDAADELSIASRFSYNSDSRFTKSNIRISSPRVKINQYEVTEADSVPFSIAVTHRSRSSGAIPPLPTSGKAAPFPQALSGSPMNVYGNVPLAKSNDVGHLPPKNPLPKQQTNHLSSLNFEYSESEGGDGDKTYRGKDPSTPIQVDAPTRNDMYVVPNSINISDGPLILSSDDLKKHAARRRSHSSLIMQERFRKSSKPLNGPDTVTEDERGMSSSGPNPVPDRLNPPANINLATNSTSDDSTTLAQPPEHMVIAIRLLRAHKSHVDQIMETLKIEMDALRDFDRLLEEPGRPTEEEVLNYFESVGLCLDQRFLVGRELQREMDRISRGEPPEL